MPRRVITGEGVAPSDYPFSQIVEALKEKVDA